MKYHWSVKLTALILAAVSAATLAVSGLSIFCNIRFGIYENANLEDKVQQMTESSIDDYVYEAAMAAAVEYVKESRTDEGTVEREIWQSNCNYTWHDRGIWPEYEYTIHSTDGTECASTANDSTPYAYTASCTVYVEDGIITDLGSAMKAFPLYEELPLNYEWTSYHGVELPGLDERTVYYELFEGGDYDRVYRLERFADTPYEVQIHLSDADMDALSEQVRGVNLMKAACGLRQVDIPIAVVSTLILLACLIYLGFAGGKRKGSDQIHPMGTNRLPLDLFFAAAACGVFFPAILGVQTIEYMGRSQSMESFSLLAVGFGACAAVMGLSVALFLMALCAQVRMGNGAWIKRTLIGRFGGWLWRLCGTLLKGFFSIFPKVLKMTRTVYRTMPLIWQWCLGLGTLFLIFLWAFLFDEGIACVMMILVGIPLVLYGAHAFGKLRFAAKRMSEGDLDTKIDVHTDMLFGNFAEFAGDLNNLGIACVEAAREKMKSERMRSELITNVSHDIKTPLTSIINYVDLLQKAETEEQRAEYLEVLDRQSQRLKKLIEDLIEMSKASSGNVPVEISENDLVEAVNQALGEFADRMANLNLNVVFRQQEESITAQFDGKVLWRVLSNLLSNVVKYVLPGTRVYVDVIRVGSKVQLSIKNISREPLNITAGELMERFVRGDESRNSDGNGLGLNIARSLMELQGGGLELTVDGDLFKVILTLNG